MDVYHVVKFCKITTWVIYHLVRFHFVMDEDLFNNRYIGQLKNSGVKFNGLPIDAQNLPETLLMESLQRFNVTMVYGPSLKGIPKGERHMFHTC